MNLAKVITGFMLFFGIVLIMGAAGTQDFFAENGQLYPLGETMKYTIIGISLMIPYCFIETFDERESTKMRESWKVIENHPGYEVSNMGQVRNRRTGIHLKPYDDGDGYLRVKLDRSNCRLHILVAQAFVVNDDPEHKTVVNHKKGKKHDCRASQLEWCTVAENTQHAWDTGLCRKQATVKRKAVHGGAGKKL